MGTADKTTLKHNSLTQRLLGLVLIISALGIIGVFTALALNVNEGGFKLKVSQLDHMTDIVMQSLSTTTDQKIVVALTPENKQPYTKPNGLFRYVIFDNNDHVITASYPTDTPIIAKQSTNLLHNHSQHDSKVKHIRLFETPALEEGFDWVGLTSQFELNDQTYYIQIAQITNHHDALVDLMIDEFFENYGWVMILTVIVLFAAIHYAIKNSLKKLTVISESSKNLDLNIPDQQLSTHNVPSELLPLVESFNKVLLRFQQSHESQKDFSAHVSHQLRTPLAVLRAKIDSNLDSQQAKSLIPEIRALERLISQILLLSHVNAPQASPFEAVNILILTRKIIADLSPGAINVNKELELLADESEQYITTGNPALLTAAINNLIDNAIKYSGDNRLITITIKQSDAIIIRVINRGKIIPNSEQRKIFQRFTRLDEHIAEGSGLGLCIAKKIAGLHQGELTLEQSTKDQTIFTLTLPITNQNCANRALISSNLNHCW